MKISFHPQSFAARLLLALFILTVVTTLSTSVPTYWLTRRQLKAQAWQNVHSARQATLWLLQAEENRLTNLAALLAERPTLQQLVRENKTAQLPDYLRAFQVDSEVNILALCQDGRLLAGEPIESELCLTAASNGFKMINGRPAILAAALLPEGHVITIVGRWLDDQFLQQLATATGTGQSILLSDGTRLATNLPGSLATAAPLNRPETVLRVNNQSYFASYTELSTQPPLVSEVALPVNSLMATANQALGLLAASTGVVALLGILGGSVYLRQLLAPLQKLTDVADEISEGNWLTAIPLFSAPREISTLASALHKSQASMLQALAERSQARDWLNSLIQSIAEGVVTVAGDSRITFFSQGAETITGWAAAEAIGRTADDVFILADGEGRFFENEALMLGKRHQVTLYTRDGQSKVVAVTSAPLTPIDESIAETALVLRDVTQEEALRHLRAYFLANISHEFRTPLSTLQASMELLMDETEALSATEMRQLLQPSYLSLVNLQTLIDNLLESSTIEAGQFQIRKRPFAIQEATATAQHIVRPLLQRREQQLQLHQPPQPLTITADSVRLSQVLVNLLTNASKYSPSGTKIIMAITTVGHKLHVAVTDHGPGIPAAEQNHVFQRFVRLDSVDREQYGVGLGLFVVKTVVEAHNGRVGVQAQPAGGSTFWFELPIAEEDENINR